MGNSGVVQVQTGKDRLSARMVANLSDGVNALSAPGRYCPTISWPSGEQIGYGYISIPVASLVDELAPTVALKSTGPAGRVKLGTRASLGYSEGTSYVALMNGYLVSYVHSFGEDSVLGIVYDDRWLLTKVTCFGRAIYDPIEKKLYFDPCQKLIFNELGWPNCLDTPNGPMFAPAYRYGYKQQFGSQEDLTEPVVGSATVRARSWTVGDICTYLRNMHYSGEGNHRPSSQVYYGNPFVDAAISWPSSMSDLIGATRVPNHFDVQNDSLLVALAKVGRKAGAYDLLVKPQGSSKSTLMYVSMYPKGREGTYLYTPDYLGAVDQNLTSNSIIHSGFVKEDISNYFSDTVIVGDPAAEERMLSTGSAGTGPSALEAAWDRGGGDKQYTFTTAAASNSDEGKFLTYIKNNGKNFAAFEAACKIWPLVFCAYRVRKGYNLWKGTKYDGAWNQGTHPRMRPVLLTGAQQNSTNPANWLPREVVVEFAAAAADTSSDTSWSPCNRYDNLQLSPDGQILFLSALRDAPTPQTWAAPGGAQYDNANMRPNHIRLTVAAEADWALVGINQDDPNRTGDRVNKNMSFSFTTVAEPLDYVEFLRGGGSDHSYPNGKAKIHAAEATFPDQCANGSELFSDIANDSQGNPGRLPRHSVVRQNDVRRVSNSGQIIQAKLNPSLAPGMAISIESSNGIKCVSVIKSVSWDGNQGFTMIELQAADQGVIYDLPAPSEYTPTSPSDTYKSDNTPGYLQQEDYNTYSPDGKGSKEPIKSPSDADDGPPLKRSDGKGSPNNRQPDNRNDELDDQGRPPAKKSGITYEGKSFEPLTSEKGATLNGKSMTPGKPDEPGITSDGKKFSAAKPEAGAVLEGRTMVPGEPGAPGISTPQGKFEAPESRQGMTVDGKFTPMPTPTMSSKQKVQQAPKPLPERRASNPHIAGSRFNDIDDE